MNHNKTIQLKALILLTVFSFSSILSFACSLGLDMGYNSGHHAEMKEAADQCCEKPSNPSEKQNSGEEDCCTNSVIDFQLMAKSVTQNNIDFSVPVYFQQHELLEMLIVLNRFSISSEMKRAVFRTSQMPPPDIRVSIHSFQI